jgi:hypothetical protein
LTNLTELFLQNNQLTNLSLSSDLNQLVQIDLRTNNLTSLTLPAGATNLTTLVVEGNPLTTFVLPEPLAATLATTVTALRNQGVSVFTYPLAIQLIPMRQPIGAFQLTISGPPGVYTVIGSTDFAIWSELGTVTNIMGRIIFTDVAAPVSPQKFYRSQFRF